MPMTQFKLELFDEFKLYVKVCIIFEVPLSGIPIYICGPEHVSCLQLKFYIWTMSRRLAISITDGDNYGCNVNSPH